MAKKRQVKAAPTGPVNIGFEQYADDVNARAADFQATPEPSTTAGEPNMASLLAQIEALKGQIDRMPAQSAPLPITSIPDPPAPPKPVSFADLPDPGLDPEGYAAEVARRTTLQVSQNVQYANTLNAAEEQHKNASDQLFADFSIQYEDYAEDEDKVEFATQQVLKRAKARNVDIQRYMYANTDKFFADVIAEYDTQFGSPTDDGDGEVEEVPAEQPVRRVSTTRPASRTGGVFGGEGSGNAPAPGKSQQKQSDMITELHAEQRKLGIF